MIMKPVTFNNTVLRDGHQSLAATRMTTAQMLPAAAILDGMGFGGLETWGGATIDACLRYLSENPFDRLRALKQAAPRTPQVMLLRGQNIVQYTSFPDDVVSAFIRATAAAGQDVFRIFDALNDTRNLATAVKTVIDCGRHARGEICYTTSPVHTVEAFVAMGGQLEAMGCHSIGIKDMSGIMTPRVAHDLVRGLKQKVGLPIILHTHDTAGLGAAAYLAAIDAGVDAVDTSISPFANGTAQPDTARMLALLDGHPRRPDYDPAMLHKLRLHFEGVYRELAKFTHPANERVDSDILVFQVPGGMLSNFRNQLAEQGMSGKFDEVVREIPVVREALGWIPLVTPTAQIVGTQAMMNVKFGSWKVICQAAQDIALGKYGKTPGPIHPDLLARVARQTGMSPVTCRPADLLEPGLETHRAACAAKGLPTDDETTVLFAMFPQQVEALHQTGHPRADDPASLPKAAGSTTAQSAQTDGAVPSHADQAQARRMVLNIDGVRHEVRVEKIAG
jgi:pyruvate carboxylase subunit B